MAGVTSDLGSSRQDFPRGSCEPGGCPAAWRGSCYGNGDGVRDESSWPKGCHSEQTDKKMISSEMILALRKHILSNAAAM